MTVKVNPRPFLPTRGYRIHALKIYTTSSLRDIELSKPQEPEGI